jgi:tRNA-intron endonuclease
MMRMTVRVVDAVFDSGEVVIHSKEDADFLIQSGYGSLREDETIALSRCEALYLLFEGRMKIIDTQEDRQLSFKPLLEMYRIVDPEIWTRYLIFRDLRSRGYVVKDGMGWGVDFRVYERGKYREKAAKYVVFSVCEGTPLAVSQLGKVLRSVHGLKKELIVAVVDRRGEIIYYALTRFNLRLRSRSSE